MHSTSRWPVTILTVMLAIVVAAVGFLSQVDPITARQDAAVEVRSSTLPSSPARCRCLLERP